ncbi:MAG: MarR family winged helix-turn-helix transcriptional regulator [Candidatus Ozemobacteraceae bacterium]
MAHESIDLFRALITTTKAVVRVIWNIHELEGLTGPQFGLLMFLRRHGHGTPSEIADAMLVSAGNITGMIERLRKQGLVERRRLSTDRRCLRIALTTEGNTRLDYLYPIWEKSVKTCFKLLPSADQKQLITLLDQVNALLPGGPHISFPKDAKESRS